MYTADFKEFSQGLNQLRQISLAGPWATVPGESPEELIVEGAKKILDLAGLGIPTHSKLEAYLTGVVFTTARGIKWGWRVSPYYRGYRTCSFFLEFPPNINVFPTEVWALALGWKKEDKDIEQFLKGEYSECGKSNVTTSTKD